MGIEDKILLCATMFIIVCIVIQFLIDGGGDGYV